ncbi:hypothetical protein [Hahella chejuensis]|nr:hypothetical protein [Hahella chejuensis]
MNPLGPDFKRAPVCSIDLSGTELRFRNPAHEAPFSCEDPPDHLDIYKIDNFDIWPNNRGMTLILARTGWGFWDSLFGGDGMLGYVMMQMILQCRAPNNRQNDSLFNPNGLSRWVLDTCEQSWGSRNREMLEERDNYRNFSPERSLWKYPKQEKDFKKMTINGNQWLYYEAGQPVAETPKKIWCTAISDDHLLDVSFQAGGNLRSYFDPKHDIDSAVTKAMNEFVNNIYINFSPSAQEERDEYSAELAEQRSASERSKRRS